MPPKMPKISDDDVAAASQQVKMTAQYRSSGGYHIEITNR